MRRPISALVLVAAGIAAAPAGAVIPVDGTAYDLASRADVRLVGAERDTLGASVAAAGDVNGDGFGDVLAGAPGTGRVHVVLGSRSSRAYDGAKPAGRGWTISGAGAGAVVAGVGDVNADGLDDVAVGIPGSDRAWVVFGARRGAAVRLGALGARGFRIQGTPGDGLGGAIAGVGDLDGDGRADLAVAEPGAGRVWLVPGRESRRTVALDPAADGARFVGGLPLARISLAGVGDVSGGGRGDLMIGSPRADGDAGRAWVVWGEALRAAPVSVAAAPFTAGLAIGSTGPATLTGAAVGGWRDASGDGIPDLLLGAPGALADPASAPSGARIVLGRRAPGPLDPNAPGASRRIAGGAGTRLGASGFGVGDVNDDGLADLVTGAPGAAPRGRKGAGQALVVFGRRGGGDVLGGAPGLLGALIDGPSTRARTGAAVSGAGDVNGDGASDVIVGSPHAQEERGQADVLLGRQAGTSGGAPPPGPYPPVPIGQANRPPDTNIEVPRGLRQRAARLRRITGNANDDRLLARVEVAVIRVEGAGRRRRCSVMRANGTFRRSRVAAGRCVPQGFLRARGTARWSLRLRRALAPGSYRIVSRGVDGEGLRELAVSPADADFRKVSVR